jgi:hypothetical protein
MLCALFWASYARPMEIVKDRDKTEKKRGLEPEIGPAQYEHS